MSYPIVTEGFKIAIHVMAQFNDWYYDNYYKYGVHGLLCDNAHDVDFMVSGYTERFEIFQTGAFQTFENNNFTDDDTLFQDIVVGPAAKATFGRPSSNVITEGFNSEPVSNLDFSASGDYTLAFTPIGSQRTSANHSASVFGASWNNWQQGPMPGGSTTKSVSLNYTSSAGPVSYSSTKTFPLIDYQYYDTSFPPVAEQFFVYANGSQTIPNSGPAMTNVTYVRQTSGQFNHTAEQFFEYA
jgi:hypothetical protein